VTKKWEDDTLKQIKQVLESVMEQVHAATQIKDMEELE